MPEIDQRAGLLADLLVTTKDGDWGKGEPTPDHVPYRVIRGADFERVRAGDLSTVPLRYLPARTVERRTLQPDDILIETAGGTAHRPTGRTLHVTRRVLDRFDYPATCASFARFMRVNPRLADPAFVFWHLQDEYARDRMREHEVRHTGVGRFQYTEYSRHHEVPLLPLDVQQRIASVLASLEDLIDTEQRIAQRADELWRTVVASELGHVDSVPLASLAGFVNGKNFTKGAGTSGLHVIRTPEVRNGPSATTVRNDVEAADDNVARAGDILFVWSGSLLVARWCWQPALVNQHIFKVIPAPTVPDWLVLWAIEELMEDFLGLAADKATTMGHIKRGDLERPVVVPDRSKWAELDDVVRPLWNEALSARIQSVALTAARDELLPMLMSGRVRVSEDLVVA